MKTARKIRITKQKQVESSMLERDKIHFFDTDGLSETSGFDSRATEQYIRSGLKRLFPGEVFSSVKVAVNASGCFQEKSSFFDRIWGKGKKITGLPKYAEVVVRHSTGQYEEELTVWSPAAWNGRFAGTCGGGRGYLTVPDNTQRGWTVPFALINGFSAATMYAGNIDGFHDLTIDPDTGELRRELYENWRLRSTHNMTLLGKAVTELLHDRKIEYSYLNGGSGGGRQSLMEAQNDPEDYDGVWASCPAINWHPFITAGFWAEAVMNEEKHFLSAAKNQHFVDAAHEAAGGSAEFYHLNWIPDFDAESCIGDRVKGGVITKKDARVMNEIWHGPHRENGERLWSGFPPGVKNWQTIIPIGTYYYPLSLQKKVKPFILGIYHARWITGNPKERFDDINVRYLEELFDRGSEKFRDCFGDDPDLTAFAAHGGKLMIDHGLDDPLIPAGGTIDYYNKVVSFLGQEKANSFIRLYVTPGDSHGNCRGNGPGITECDGMKALMDWVEKGTAPEAIRKVRVDPKTGETLETGTQMPYRPAR